jgi:Tol biopolymer transport system component
MVWGLPPGARREAPAAGDVLSVGTDATNLAYNARSKRLVFSRNQSDANIYRVGLRAPGILAGVTEPFIVSTRFDYHPRYSPNGDAVAFVSTRSGSEQIWVANADGSSPRQITSMEGPITGNPRWSPDGRAIVFDTLRDGSRGLYLANPQGGPARRLTDQPSDGLEAEWSLDGRSIYFNSDRSGRMEVWRMPAAGGEAVQVTRSGGGSAMESPDGRWLYYARGPLIGAELWRAPLAGGDETRVLEGLSNRLSYAVTKDGIYYTQARSALDRLSLEFLDLRSGRVRHLLTTNGRMFIGVTLSPDGRSLLWSQVDAHGADLMLVEGVR